MQMVKNAFIVFLSIWISFLVFMPKKELYFALEKELSKSGIELNEKSIDSNIFGLDIKDIDVYVENIKLAHIAQIDFKTLLFFNTVNIDKISIDSSLKSMLPQDINHTEMRYSIFNPKEVTVSSSGDFGFVKGYINIDKTLHLDFIKALNIKPFQRELKKGENGWYYEKKF